MFIYVPAKHSKNNAEIGILSKANSQIIYTFWRNKWIITFWHSVAGATPHRRLHTLSIIIKIVINWLAYGQLICLHTSTNNRVDEWKYLQFIVGGCSQFVAKFISRGDAGQPRNEAMWENSGGQCSLLNSAHGLTSCRLATSKEIIIGKWVASERGICASFWTNEKTIILTKTDEIAQKCTKWRCQGFYAYLGQSRLHF